MSYVHRVMIVPQTLVAKARALASGFPSTKDMWTVELQSEENVTTHYISSGPVDSSLAELLEDPEKLSQATGASLVECKALLNACVVSKETDWQKVVSDLGLKVKVE